MLDIKFVRDNQEAVAEAMKNRHASWDASRFSELDEPRRAAIAKEEALQAERNAASKSIGAMMGAGQKDEAEAAKERVRAINDELAVIGKEREAADEALRDLLLATPNMPADSTPVGASEDDNPEVRRWGTPRDFAAEGFELFTEALDVCDAEKLYAFGDHVIEKFGRLDVWMNNAGIAITKPLLEFTEEEWNRVLDLNLNAVFHGSQYAARKMIALGNGGVILNAGSFQALMPAAAAVPYGTTKAAVVMFSRTFAAEMAPYNIRVLSYIPGVISTPMAIDWLNETDQIRNIPSYRYGQPEDLANALVFVSSDRASYINGVHIDVTGGKFCVQNPRYAFEHMDKSK